jgi:spoIIIJ-associated protein
MEWVETTGRTVEEAKDAALDQLGVDEQDAEFDVIEEPKTGLFGRLRGEARVRARVRPTTPRPKEDRRDRRRRNERSGGRGGRSRTPKTTDAGSDSPPAPRPSQPSTSAEPSSSSRGEQRRPPKPKRDEEREPVTSIDVPLAEQADVARTFLLGLVEQFGLRAEVTTADIDEDTVELRVDGDDLGLLIGPRGQTLSAVQDLARTVVQRQTGGANGRLLVDVSGYRQKRRVALERFTREMADKAKADGRRVVLEPMSPADRKVIHDTVNDIEGVATASEGEEPRRRVVIIPDAD